MINTFMLIFTTLSINAIDLVSLDMYETRAISLHRVSGNLLITSKNEHKLGLVDNFENIIATYNKVGKGPEEIFSPYILQITKDRIYIVSDGHRIMTFDHSLNLINNDGRVPARLTGARSPGYQWKDRVFVSGSRRSQHALYEMTSTGQKREYLGGFFHRGLPDNYDPQSINEMDLDRTLSCRFHNGMFFVTGMGGKVGADSYEIYVYHEPKEMFDPENANLILAAPIDEFPSYLRQYSVFFGQVASNDSGFMVQIRAKNPVTQKPTQYWDYFSTEGGYIKRVEVTDKSIIRVANSNEIFILDESNENSLMLKLINK